MSELWTTAVHEAGHAVAAFQLGATVHAGPVSIVPGGTFRGICFTGTARRYPDGDLDGLTLPYPLMPTRLRRFYETQAMMLLAGQIAADLYAGRSEPVPELVASPEAEPVGLPARESVLLEQAAASDSHDTDFSRAHKILMALHFDDEHLADTHGRFLAAETEVLLGSRTVRPMIEALARELMAARTLSAKRWLSVLREAA